MAKTTRRPRGAADAAPETPATEMLGDGQVPPVDDAPAPEPPAPEHIPAPEPGKPTGRRTPEQRARRRELERLARQRAAQTAEQAGATYDAERAGVQAATASARAATGKRGPGRPRKVDPAAQQIQSAIKLCESVWRSTLILLPETWGGGDAPEEARMLGEVYGPCVAPYLGDGDGAGGWAAAAIVTAQVLIVRSMGARARKRNAEPESAQRTLALVPQRPAETPEPGPDHGDGNGAGYDPPR